MAHNSINCYKYLIKEKLLLTILIYINLKNKYYRIKIIISFQDNFYIYQNIRHNSGQK